MCRTTTPQNYIDFHECLFYELDKMRHRITTQADKLPDKDLMCAFEVYFAEDEPVIVFATIPVCAGRCANIPPQLGFIVCGPVAPDIDGEPPVPTIGAYNGLLLEPSRDGFVAPRGHCPNRLKSDIGALVTMRNEWFVERLLKLRAIVKADRSVVRKTQRIRCVRLTHAPAPRGTSIDVSRVSDNGTLQFEVALGQRPPKAQGKAKGPDVGANWLATPLVC